MPTSEQVDRAVERATHDPLDGTEVMDDRLTLAIEVVRLRSYGQQFAKVEAELRAEIARLRKADE